MEHTDTHTHTHRHRLEIRYTHMLHFSLSDALCLSLFPSCSLPLSYCNVHYTQMNLRRGPAGGCRSGLTLPGREATEENVHGLLFHLINFLFIPCWYWTEEDGWVVRQSCKNWHASNRGVGASGGVGVEGIMNFSVFAQHFGHNYVNAGWGSFSKCANALPHTEKRVSTWKW